MASPFLTAMPSYMNQIYFSPDGISIPTEGAPKETGIMLRRNLELSARQAIRVQWATDAANKPVQLSMEFFDPLSNQWRPMTPFEGQPAEANTPQVGLWYAIPQGFGSSAYGVRFMAKGPGGTARLKYLIVDAR